jgi:hypothetical protein
MQSTRKAPPNLTSLPVKGLTIAKREKDAQKETAVQTNETTTAAQIELSRKIDTLTQGMTLDMTIATLPETIPPTTLTTPPLDIDHTPKNVIIIAMIETLPTSVTLDAIPHIITMVEIVLRHPMLTPSKEIPL